MRLLLDTHVALWAVTADKRLSPDARRRITKDADEIFVSAASLWEVAIKHSLARGDMPVDARGAAAAFVAAGFVELAVTWKHVQGVARLPLLHKDPFDRLLVAQALEEPLVLMTHDVGVAAYSRSFLRI